MKDSVLIVSRITLVDKEKSRYRIDVRSKEGTFSHISYFGESNKFKVGDTVYIKK